MTTTIETPASAAAEERRKHNSGLLDRYHQVTPGSSAEEEMVKEHLPLVKTVVGRLAMTLPAHVEMDDLYSAGLIGLLNAVRHFDPKGGSSFETYARVRIRGAILDELRRLDWVPRSVHAKARKVQAVIQELEQSKGQMPTNDEIAKVMGLTGEEYEHLMDEIKPATFVCLDSVQTSEASAETSRYESIPDESQQNPVEAASRRELSAVIAERLEQLPEIQRKVLALYYFEDMRLREIAQVFNVTESRICQIHAQAILSIKNYLQRREGRIS
jgi:RNA polymerase sigma factor for flagellar operon FliA